jgi:hypothetical protein
MHKVAHIFAGPSLFGSGLLPAADDEVTWMPPVRRGDIERLLEIKQEPAVIAIADGTFHAYPSVSHVEIRTAIENGWTVYGLCSMGAIRAAEMRHLGMVPWGRVASKFCQDPNLPDDEVALVHGSDAPYVSLSEPLVHMREFLSWALDCGLLSQDEVRQVATSLRNRWYGERTLGLLEREMRIALRVAALPSELQNGLDDFGRFRLKQADLAAFVKVKPWMIGG